MSPENVVEQCEKPKETLEGLENLVDLAESLNNVEAETTENTENPAQEPAPSVAEPKYFKTKKIRFGPIEYMIVTQNLNGPCPLIAIINALVLKGKLTIPKQYVVTSSDLLTLLTNKIISGTPSSSDQQEIFENNLSDVLTLMETIVNGLDVNIKFSSVDQFEFTPALSLFDLVLVKLYHVWLPDPQFPVIFDLISHLNYNQLVVRMCEESSDEAEIMRNFYNESLSQITFHGLASLLATMKDGEIAVLFHNNHFSTVLKRRDEIFKLVTDEGLADEPNVIWETFSDIAGDCIFVNADFGNFKPITPPAQIAPEPSPSRSSSEIHREAVEIGVEAVERPCSVPPTVIRSEVMTSPRRSTTADNVNAHKKQSNCGIM